jgi:hypothetical protein
MRKFQASNNKSQTISKFQSSMTQTPFGFWIHGLLSLSRAGSGQEQIWDINDHPKPSPFEGEGGVGVIRTPG